MTLTSAAIMQMRKSINPPFAYNVYILSMLPSMTALLHSSLENFINTHHTWRNSTRTITTSELDDLGFSNNNTALTRSIPIMTTLSSLFSFCHPHQQHQLRSASASDLSCEFWQKRFWALPEQQQVVCKTLLARLPWLSGHPCRHPVLLQIRKYWIPGQILLIG